MCTSVNEVICHGIPDKRPLQEGDIVNIDVSVYHNGVHSDLNETYPVGKVEFFFFQFLFARPLALLCSSFPFFSLNAARP